MSYFFDVSNNNRAACKNTQCKQKCVKGSLRCATVVEIMGSASNAYRHACCVTEKQLNNLKAVDITQQGGYSALDADAKALLAKVLAGECVGKAEIKDLSPSNALAVLGGGKPAPAGDDKVKKAKKSSKKSEGGEKPAAKAPGKEKKEKSEKKEKKSKKDKKE